MDNHNLPAKTIATMDAGIPRVLAIKPYPLIYYYRHNIEDPDRNMAVIAKHLRSLRSVRAMAPRSRACGEAR
jgi:hypothetical protein